MSHAKIMTSRDNTLKYQTAGIQAGFAKFLTMVPGFSRGYLSGEYQVKYKLGFEKIDLCKDNVYTID